MCLEAETAHTLLSTSTGQLSTEYLRLFTSVLEQPAPIHCADMEGFFAAQSGLLPQDAPKVRGDIVATGPCYIHPSAKIDPSVTLQGPVYIGADCHVGAKSVLSATWLEPGAQVADHSWVSHMIVGPDWAADYRYAHNLPLNLTPLGESRTDDTGWELAQTA